MADEERKVTDRHSQNSDGLDSWKFYADSYAGGVQYREGAYLHKHENESTTAFDRRHEQACFVNFCSPVVDIYNSYLFRETPIRDFGNINAKVLELFRKNADRNGRRYHKVIRETNRRAAVYGFMGVIIDKPTEAGEANRQEEVDNLLIPYISVYKPANILYWERVRSGGVTSLSYLVLEEDAVIDGSPQYKIWTPENWELWGEEEGKEGTNSEPIMLDSGNHDLGRIPFVLVPNRDTFDFMSGISDLADIADINRNIYYYDSDAMEIIERTAFPFLEAPFDSLGGGPDEDIDRENEDGDVEVGSGNMLERDVADTIGHRWIEPKHESLARILEWRRQGITDIQMIAKMGAPESASGGSDKAESGSALEVRFQQLNAVLSDKAENMETAEEQILDLVALWEGVPDWTGSVTYPRKFGVRDLITDLDNALRSKKTISSVKFNILLQKGIANRVLSDLNVETADREEVMRDIEATVPTEAVTKRPDANSQDLNRGGGDPEAGDTGVNTDDGNSVVK